VGALEVVRRIIFTMIRLKHKVAVEKKIAALKIQFFTNISHELRTPLTLIVNPLLKLKQTETLSEKGVKYLHVARRNTDRMDRFDNQMLDFPKNQKQKVQPHVNKIELVSFLTEISHNFADIEEYKHIYTELMSSHPETQMWY